jgi:hypothetical protein
VDDHREFRVHVSGLLTRWQGAVAGIYIKFGASPAVADEDATVLLAALEGALILAVLAAASIRSTQSNAISPPELQARPLVRQRTRPMRRRSK